MGGSKVPFYVAHRTSRSPVARSRPKASSRAYVVEDRELITGQNPPSDHGIADLFVKALDRHVAATAAR